MPFPWPDVVSVHLEGHLVYVKWQKMLLVHGEWRLVYVEGFGVWGSGEFIIFVVENHVCPVKVPDGLYKV
jgi:hypothetical protein